MRNVNMKVKDSILTITVDLSQGGVPSSSGKSIVVASTEGSAAVADTPYMVGLNVYKKK